MTKFGRQPMRRGSHDLDMNLPDGKTCGDCAHVKRCCAMFGHIPEDEVCDFSPSRFVAAALSKGPTP